jgi:hypothetical protein
MDGHVSLTPFSWSTVLTRYRGRSARWSVGSRWLGLCNRYRRIFSSRIQVRRRKRCNFLITKAAVQLLDIRWEMDPSVPRNMKSVGCLRTVTTSGCTWTWPIIVIVVVVGVVVVGVVGMSVVSVAITNHWYHGNWWW